MEHLTKQSRGYGICHEYLLFNQEDSPLSKEEFFFIQLLMSKLSYENISKGDAGDIHKLSVGRFRRDTNYPIDQSPLTKLLMRLLNSKKMKEFYKLITGINRVCLRRIQSNVLHEGDFVGIHIDGKGDIRYKGTHVDYKYAVIIHFESDYNGGETILYSASGKLTYILPAYSILVITGSLPHEVKKIKSGVRKTLAIFLSDNFGKSSY